MVDAIGCARFGRGIDDRMAPFGDSVRAAAGRLKSQLETMAMKQARKDKPVPLYEVDADVFSEHAIATIDLICGEHGVSRGHVFSRSRIGRIARARKFVWLYLHDTASWSYPEIGRAFGRDHTTVMSGVKSVRRGPRPIYPQPAPSLSCRPVKVEGEGAWLVFGEGEGRVKVPFESVSFGPPRLLKLCPCKESTCELAHA